MPLLFVGPPGQLAVSHAEADQPNAEASVLKAADALYDGIRVETLPNGLRVFLKPVAGAATVTTMVAYKVGSSDEDLDSTGLAHYLEHLMFKGTEKILPGDIDRATLRSGGANNAYTTDDYTVYHFDFASEYWEVPLKIEADRMRNIRIDEKHEFQQEKGAVIAELERNEDRPWDLEEKAMLPVMFGKTGPYGHPVIGEREHVRGATAEIIKRFYDRWYHPNNAVLVVCGGFDPDKTFAKIKELFGPLPKVDLPARKIATEVKRGKPVKQEFKSKFDVPRMMMGFNGVPSGHADSYALDLAVEVLTAGKTSRLYKKMIEGAEIANVAQANNYTGRFPGWFSVNVELIQGKDRNKAEQIVLAELKALRDAPVSEVELKRVKRGLIAAEVFRRESVHNLADNIATGVTTNDLDYLKTYLPKIAAVTAADVQRVAKKYLDPEQRVTVWSVPEEQKGADIGPRGASGGAHTARLDAAPPRRSSPSAARAMLQAAPAAPAAPFSLKSAQRVELPNGLTLLLFENRRLPIFVASAMVNHVRLLEPEEKLGVATMVGRLMDEGTTKHTGHEIAELIEDVGGSLSMGFSGSRLKVLTPDRKLGLGLLFECLLQPTFPQDAFNRHRQQLLSEIADLETQPEERASILYNKMVYDKHPFGRHPLGNPKAIEKLTPADCKAVYQQLCVPNNTTVAIVGDFDTKEVVAEITKLTADWKKGAVPKPQPPAVTPPAKFTEKIVTMPDAAQLQFYMGHPGIKRDNPDYYKLLVMDYVLGVGPGFTDRLSSRLRDRQGLAYTVSATITNSAGEEPGLFTCYIGTQPQNFEKVKAIFLEELKRIREEKAKPQEVDDAKKYLLGNLPFRFTTNDGIAGQLLSIERYKLGFNYLDDYRKAVGAVTPDDVLAVAKKYLDPQKMVLVVAGAVDQNGRPILKLEKPKQ
ncbi:peptidase [Planctomycetaceae bacterium SCGC AG-212-F19]|nr:peptidase [Planctomycetaceae bacterium SCGC AG-212-F19]